MYKRQVYDVGSSTFTADDVTVSASGLPASGTVGKDNFTVQVAVGGANYTVGDYSFTDQMVDVENGDATVGFNVGGAMITKVVPEAAVPAIDGLEFLTDAEKEMCIRDRAQLQEIAELKMPDLNAANVEAAMSMIAGTCRSMGVKVED